MAFHDDLLNQAYHLARRDKKRPKQANLRRAGGHPEILLPRCKKCHPERSQ